MNREHAKRVLPVIAAYIAGTTVQVRHTSTGVWRDVENPTFSSALQYRIKPELVEKWIVVYADNRTRWAGAMLFSSAEAATEHARRKCKSRNYVFTLHSINVEES